MLPIHAMARMLEQRRPTANGLAARSVFLLLLGLVACFGGPLDRPTTTRLGAFAQALAGGPGVRWAEVEARGRVVPEPGTGLLVVDDDWRLPTAGWPDEQREALLAFVHNGGRLVLFGHAAHVVAELGIEGESPERTVFRWGFDARAIAGRAELGFQVVSGRQPELFEGLPGSAAGADVHFLAGASPCTAPLCSWSIGAPRHGEVLARLAVQRDGATDPLGAPVVVHWTHGKGEVLACGLLPRLDHEDEAVRATAQAFVQKCAAWARGRGPLLVLAAARREAEPAVAALPRMAPLVPHWGWTLPQHVDGVERTADELLTETMLPSWFAGADLCELELAGADGTVPLEWRSGDPLRPAPSFESQLATRQWHAGTFRSLAQEAHGRGLLAFGSLDPLPVGGRAVERLATLRFLARELACVRRLGDGALDGFGVREWLHDRVGYSTAMLQDFQPAGAVYVAGEGAPAVAGALRAMDAADGAVAGLPFRGVSAQWRAGFGAADFPLGRLEAAAPADWIVTQANDFVRSRAGRGAALQWRRDAAAPSDGRTVDYVHGVSLEPLRAAVAMPLAATGSDGLRAAGARSVPGLASGFGAHVAAPAGVHALQNNWFRLLGSGGGFHFDPRGEADFGAGSLDLSPGLLRTRLLGGRPDGRAVRSERFDLLRGGARGEGGYEERELVSGLADAVAAVPAVLERGVAPQWPGAVVFDWQADVGYHELELGLRTVRGRGIVSISLDGVLLRALPFGETTGEQQVVPVHVARGGARQLAIAVVDAGAVAFDRLVLRRAGDVGVEATVVTPAGSFAALQESSQSSYHSERLEFATVADFPGFVVKARCERAARNLQVQRILSLPAYQQLAQLSPGDEPETLRRPFVLRAAEPQWPDLIVAPLQGGRYEHLRWREGELSWRTAPESGTTSRLGILCCLHGEGARWLPHAAAMLAAISDPMTLALDGAREATVLDDLPLPWTRVVRIEGQVTTPFLVREQGWWYARGSQPGDGARWLRLLHTAGDTIQIVGGPAVLARTRPGPGSARLLAMRDPEPGAVTVRVLQPSALTTPSVTMGRDFQEVLLDGVAWSHFDGRTVFLPNVAGTYRVVTKSHAGDVAPHVRSTRAPLASCRWVPAERALVLSTGGDGDRPAELAWTAVLAGPRPLHIDNGEIVDDQQLRYPDAEAAAMARAGGVLIRFRNGTCTVRYGD